MSSSRNRRRKKKADTSARSQTARHDEERHDDGTVTVVERVVRATTETRPARATTELAAYVLAVLAVVMTALAVDRDGPDGTDPFGTDLAVQLIALLTLGYLLARGLAKSGSDEGRDRDDDHEDAAVDRDPDHGGDGDDHLDDDAAGATPLGPPRETHGATAIGPRLDVTP